VPRRRPRHLRPAAGLVVSCGDPNAGRRLAGAVRGATFLGHYAVESPEAVCNTPYIWSWLRSDGADVDPEVTLSCAFRKPSRNRICGLCGVQSPGWAPRDRRCCGKGQTRVCSLYARRSTPIAPPPIAIQRNESDTIPFIAHGYAAARRAAPETGEIAVPDVQTGRQLPPSP
jgi:hypothetical protein